MSPEPEQPPEIEAKSGTDKTWDLAGRMRGGLDRLAADTASCIRFFSRLPLPRVNELDDPAAPPDFTRVSRAAPLAGFVVALPAAGLGLFLGYSGLPSMAVAVLIAGTLAITTGALHEDGLSDVADGFFGGTSREKRLDIMKDSRIGAFGALALVLATVLRISLLMALWQRFTPADAALLFLAGEAFSRALLVWQWHELPPARPGGLADRFGKPARDAVHQAFIVSLVLLLPAVLILSLPSFSLAFLLAALSAYACGRLARSRIGGATGDVLGAIQQISGLGFLVGMLMVP